MKLNKYNILLVIWRRQSLGLNSDSDCDGGRSVGVRDQRHDPAALTHFIQQSLSSEANRFSASQEISRILWKPKVHCRVYNSQPSVPILS
jgi:hypothetical protein